MAIVSAAWLPAAPFKPVLEIQRADITIPLLPGFLPYIPVHDHIALECTASTSQASAITSLLLDLSPLCRDWKKNNAKAAAKPKKKKRQRNR